MPTVQNHCETDARVSRAAGSLTGWAALVVVLVLYTLSYLDRTLFSLVVQPIKATFGISDVRIGLLQGVSFALFYAVIGLPAGWAVDRYSRRWIISLASRSGRRPPCAVRHWGAVTLPFIGRIEGWQTAFLILGAPGIMLGLLIFLVRENTGRPRLDHLSPQYTSWGEFFAFVKMRHKLLFCHLLGFPLLAFCILGFHARTPAYMGRRFGMQPAEIGRLLAITSAAAGPLIPALVSDRVFHDQSRLGLSLSIVVGIAAPVAVLLLAFGMKHLRAALTEEPGLLPQNSRAGAMSGLSSMAPLKGPS
jgi:MFS family permease